MALLAQDATARISAAIQAVEQTANAELVTVLARKADNYYYIPTLWAALMAMATPLVLIFSPFWLEPLDIFLAQSVVFVLFAGLGRIPAVTAKLIPRAIRFYRAQNLARRQFLEQNLHRTDKAMGVLIFVSEMEHFVEILADQGVSAHVDDSQWQTIVDEFTHHVSTGEVERGFLRAVEQCGALLQQVAPATSAKDELPNHLVLLDD